MISDSTRSGTFTDDWGLLPTSLRRCIRAALLPLDLVDRDKRQVQSTQLVEDPQQGSLVSDLAAELGPLLSKGLHIQPLEPFRPAGIQLRLDADLVAAAQERLALRGLLVMARCGLVLVFVFIACAHAAS